MDGVGTPIIERPRPLPGHDTPNAAHNTYTLKCEEPENGNDSNSHLLSATLREYYNNSSKLANRFKQIGWSLGANNSTEAYQKISEYADLDSAVLEWFLAGYVKEEIRLTACRKLAEFIY